MTRPTLPTPGDPSTNGTWGPVVVNAINSVSDKADTAQSGATAAQTLASSLQSASDATFQNALTAYLATKFTGTVSYNSGTHVFSFSGGTSTVDKFSVQLASGSAIIASNAVPGGLLIDITTTVTTVYLHADTAPVGSAFSVSAQDVNGLVYFAQTIAAGAKDQATAAVTAISIPAGTRLFFNVTSVGSTTPASGVVLDFVCDSTVSGGSASSSYTTYINDTFPGANGTAPGSLILGATQTGANLDVQSGTARLTTNTAGDYAGVQAVLSTDGTNGLQLIDFDWTQTFTADTGVFPKLVAGATVKNYGGDTAFEVNLNNGNLGLKRVNGFTAHAIGSASSFTGITGATAYIMRWRKQGNHHQFWIAAGTTLPGSPTLDVTDDATTYGGTLLTSAGYLSTVAGAGAANLHAYVDNLYVTSPR